MLDKLNPSGARGIRKLWCNSYFSHWTQLVKQWKWVTKTSIKIHTYLHLGK